MPEPFGTRAGPSPRTGLRCAASPGGVARPGSPSPSPPPRRSRARRWQGPQETEFSSAPFPHPLADEATRCPSESPTPCAVPGDPRWSAVFSGAYACYSEVRDEGARGKAAMRAALMRGARLVVDTVPEPTPGPGEVLVKTLACGICGSDLHALRHADRMVDAARRTGSPFSVDPARDMVMGHEF